MALRRAGSRLALASALLGLALGSLAMPAAAAQPAESCAANPGHKTSILFVHGLLGKGSDWKQFMDYVNQHVDNVQTEAFDYSGVNTQWVTNPAIGPRLTSHITCMYQASGKPVVVVAHSMGGLATREALGKDPNLVSKIGLAVTVATPNTGSDAARDAIVLAQSVCALTGCQAATNGALQAMSAYRGLASGSKELQDLPDWPKTLPVYAMAGNITPVYYLPYFNASKFSWELTPLDGSPSNTDTLVTTGSALHGVQAKGMGGTTEFGCKANAPILPMLTQATCEHGALIMSDQNNVRSKTVEVIKGYLAGQLADLEYAGILLHLPSGWKLQKNNPQDGQNYEDAGLTAPGSSCRVRQYWETPCAHVRLVTEANLQRVYHIWDSTYEANRPYYPSAGLQYCPGTTLFTDGEKLLSRRQVTIGGKTAIYSTWKFGCSAQGQGQPERSYTQQTWYFPGRLLIVDDWGTGFDQYVDRSTWR